MVLLNPISEKLRTLRLGGMLKAFAEQSENGLYSDLSFNDRFALLVESEVLERENKALGGRIGKARFREQAEIEDIRASHSRGIDKSMIMQLNSGDWVRSKQNIIITAASGCGKTYIASALARRACILGYSSRYFRSSALSAELENARTEGRLQRLIKQLAKIEVLIVDDFCLAAMTESEEKDLFELVEERYRVASTIFTSQNPTKIWHGLMPNPAIADAILDRIVHGAVRIELKGSSRRKGKEGAIEVDAEA